MDKLNSPMGRPPLGIITRCLSWLAGADAETLSQCPKHDRDCVVAIALLMLGVWAYQTFLFSIIFHRMLADDGAVHWQFVLIAAFAATLVMLIDSFMVMRSGWHLHGLEELKRGGLDLTGGWGPKIKNGIFLALRILLSLGMAQLTAIFTSLILFQPDVTAEIGRVDLAANAGLTATISRQVDAEIQRAADAVTAEETRVTALANQLGGMREATVDPAAGDPQVKAAQTEVDRLTDGKAKRDQELLTARTFAANELAGIKGAPGNSGLAGDGPVRRAAEERAQAAVIADTSAAEALVAANARLDGLRKQALASAGNRGKEAGVQIPALQQELTAETAQLAALRRRLAALTADRDQAIRQGIDNSPGHVGHDSGLLAQIAALHRVAADPEILAVILLIDFVSFGIELAAVLAKVTSFVPTAYSGLLAWNTYLKTASIVDEAERRLNRNGNRPDNHLEDSDGKKSEPADEDVDPDGEDDEDEDADDDETGPANDNGNDSVFIFGPALTPGGNPPPKRPRGRPRKNPPPQ